MSTRLADRVYFRQLCSAGLDPIVVMPEILLTIRRIVPADAAAFFWTDRQGLPAAHLHESSPESACRLFAENFELFTGPGEINIPQLTVGPGPKIGKLLRPPAYFFRSNTFQLLIRAAGHRHTLDACIESQGGPLGSMQLFREPGRGFAEAHVTALHQLMRYLEFALTQKPLRPQDFEPGGGSAIVVASPDGKAIWMSPGATHLLQQHAHVGDFWARDSGRLPSFCRRLCSQLTRLAQGETDGIPACSVPVPNGRLRARAHWLKPEPGASASAHANSSEGLIGIVLDLDVSIPLKLLRRLAASPLSPRQREVAYEIAVESSKEDACRKLGLSEVTWKEHARQVYERMQVHSRAELTARLMNPQPGAH